MESGNLHIRSGWPQQTGETGETGWGEVQCAYTCTGQSIAFSLQLDACRWLRSVSLSSLWLLHLELDRSLVVQCPLGEGMIK